MGRASRARRERREAYQERQRTRWVIGAPAVAAVVLVAVGLLLVAAVAVAWWAEPRTGGVFLGVLAGKRNAGVLGVAVPDGRLALAAAGLTVVPVLLAAVGLVATHRSGSTRPSRLTGVAAAVALVVTPAVAGTYVATTLTGPDSGWVVLAQLWPYCAVFASVVVVPGLVDAIPWRVPAGHGRAGSLP